MFGRKQQPIITDEEYGTLSLQEYKYLVSVTIDNREIDLENAIIDGNALDAKDLQEALKVDRGRLKFASIVESNPDTPILWKPWKES